MQPKILFLDQSGKLGGAELSLLDVAEPYRETCLVGLFADGTFRQALEHRHIPVDILTEQTIQVQKENGVLKSLGSFRTLIPLIGKVTQLARQYDVIYTNTQKAFVVGAIASALGRRPLVYHLRDILSVEHFSQTNLKVAVTLANLFADVVIANSEATRQAFIDAGGRANLTTVIYNGFQTEKYQVPTAKVNQIRQNLGVENQFVIGHFSRLSPWKGQHILLEALPHCPENMTVLLLGDALFGEDEYVDQLHQTVERLQLQDRVKILGFQTDIIPLMAASDMITHTSTAPEPFGRVIIEAMLCDTPIVVAAAGGVLELIEHNRTGWLVSPENPEELAQVINTCYQNPEMTQVMTQAAKIQAAQRFDLEKIRQQIQDRLEIVSHS
ncbi:MAG: glycosyltransferase family 4 protein [Microcoleaceae cyanobacterium]